MEIFQSHTEKKKRREEIKIKLNKSLAQEIKKENPSKYDDIEDADIPPCWAIEQLISPLSHEKLESISEELKQRVFKELFGDKDWER